MRMGPVTLYSIVREVKVKVAQSCPTLRPHGLYNPWNSPGQNTGVGSHSLLQESFLTQGSNPGLPHCRWILYQLSHQGSLTIKSRFLGLSLINQLPLSNLEGDLTN